MAVKKILNILRTNEWWSIKLASHLGSAYACILLGHGSFSNLWTGLLLIFLSLIPGAAFVSILNDICDKEEDEIAQKRNRMSGISKRNSLLILSIPFLAILYEVYYFRNYPELYSFILLTTISYFLYSVPPFRLKNRQFLGILADACGAHFFVTLFILNLFTSYYKLRIPTGFCIGLSIWSLAYGIRGILWHQFYDLTNDLLSKTNTFATVISYKQAKRIEKLIFGIECLSLASIVLFLHEPLLNAILVAYFILLLFRILFLGQQYVIAISKTQGFNIVMFDFYEFLFPISILFIAGINDPFGYILLIMHGLLFPLRMKQLLKDLALSITLIKNKLIRP